MQRKLAAILAADVVGFSRHMGKDEEATLAVLRARLQAAEKLVGAHGGRVFGGAGDSMVAEFPSAVQAVACALAIQEEAARDDAELPAGERMQLRIGVAVGDVMVEEDGLYGEVVNLADRLQAMAPAGGICISEAVHGYVKKRIAAGYEDLGRRSLKNVVEPVRVHRVLAGGEAKVGLRRLRPRRLAALGLAAAALAAIAVFVGLALWRGEGAGLEVAQPRGEAPELARPEGHFRVERPAELDDADAYTIYERIRGAMWEVYARSGIDHAAQYSGWRKYNTTPYLSATHGNRYVNNYANDRAVTYGLFEAAGRMPEGAVLAKDSFEVTEHGDVVTGPLFLMEKMAEGFDAETRDWRYTMIMPDGRLFGRTGAEHGGRVAFCADCHEAAGPENDDLYFLPEPYRRRFLQIDGAGRSSSSP